MKTKLDFVTNSSSASFVVMGTRISIDTIKTKDNENDLYIPLYDIVKGTDLDFSFGAVGSYEADDFIVGICYKKMGEDETLRQFKERATQEIKKAFGKDVKVGHIEEGWEDR